MVEPAKPDHWPLVVGVNHRSSSMMLRQRLFMEDAEVPAFLERLRAAVPAVSQLHAHIESLRKAVLAEAGDDADKATLLLIGRLLQRPSEEIRRMAADDAEILAVTERLVCELFGLDCVGNGSDDSEGD